ncbi:MAG: hypothetical protein ACO1RA_12555 [Planctomycetaceae bacterium]
MRNKKRLTGWLVWGWVGLVLAGCVSPHLPDVVKPGSLSEGEKLAAEASNDYARRLAENFEQMQLRLSRGEALTEEQAHAELSKGATQARQEAFAEVNAYLQREFSREGWRQETAVRVFGELARGHRRRKS